MPRVRVPDLACAIVAASDESAAALVESTVGQRKQMGPQDFEQSKALLLVLLLLLNELLDKFFKLGFACFGNQGLLQEDLVDQSVNICL